jgi:thermolysin
MSSLFRPALCVLALVVVSVAAFAAMDEPTYGENRLRDNPEIRYYRESPNGVVELVSGNLGKAAVAGTEIQTTIEFFSENVGAFKMTSPAEELVVNRIERDPKGNQHARFDQYYRGFRVCRGQMISHFDRDGNLVTVNGRYWPGITLSTSPTVTAAVAEQTALADVSAEHEGLKASETELQVLPWEGKYYLVWHLKLMTSHPKERWEYFVDANTGEVVYSASLIREAEAIGDGYGVLGIYRNHLDAYDYGGSFTFEDYTRQAANDIHGHGGQMLPGEAIRTYISYNGVYYDLEFDDDNHWVDSGQAPAVDAHFYTGLMYDYLLDSLNRNGIQDAGYGMEVRAVSAITDDDNAYWNGSYVTFTGWSEGRRSLAGCPDVVAHEWGHGVTSYTSDLWYMKESGALNESFSDMIGTAFEFAHPGLDTPDWLCAENGDPDGVGFRSMSEPHLYGDPDYYGPSDPYWIDVEYCDVGSDNDQCGVHTNSGVGNKWFYLLSEGGTHHDVTVTGIGIENAIRVAYWANAYFWNYDTDYHLGAYGTLLAAQMMGAPAEWETAIVNAWEAVGVRVPPQGLSFAFVGPQPRTVPADAGSSFQVQFTGEYEGLPAPGSGTQSAQIGEGAWQSASMTDLGGGLYTASTPPTPCGQVIRYYFGAQTTTGRAFSFGDVSNPYWVQPVRVAELKQPPVGIGTDLWSWYGDAVDGQWDYGYVGSGDRGDPPVDFDNDYLCFLTDAEYGNSDVDGGASNLVSPAMDLSYMPDALVVYARWFSNNIGANPAVEVMNVYVSDDDGSTWVPVETVGPTRESGGGWYEYMFRVSDFVVPTDQVRLRFEARDYIGAVVEAAIDAVRVLEYDCDHGLCGDITGDENVNLWDITVMIDYVFMEGSAPRPLVWANTDASADRKVTLNDITKLIANVYIDHLPITCY